jgi:peptide subunit release factor 1 (eRF1)
MKSADLHFPGDTVERLEALREMTGAADLIEVLKNAIKTYESIENHRANGVEFFAGRAFGELEPVEWITDVGQPSPPGPRLRLVKGDAQ